MLFFLPPLLLLLLYSSVHSGLYEAELNPVDHQKANALKYQMERRPFFEMPSHLADVDLDEYDYEEDFE